MTAAARRAPAAGTAARAMALLALLAGWGLAAGCDKLMPHRLPGETLYRENCSACHGLDGRGNTALGMGQQYADLTDDAWKFGGDDGSIANSVREGSFGLMPGFQGKLTEQQIQDVVGYLKVLRQKAGAVAQ
jgi:cbb3-type cytochrome c oxidase subunit III